MASTKAINYRENVVNEAFALERIISQNQNHNHLR
jgi:hypothetical protein